MDSLYRADNFEAVITLIRAELRRVRGGHLKPDAEIDSTLTMSERAYLASLWRAAGVVFRAQSMWDAALTAFSMAVRLNPQDHDSHTYMGMILLTLGRFAEGWRAYAHRWQANIWVEKMRYPAEALWDGVIHPNLPLLLWCEQGFGDAIQFSRYAPWLQAQGASVTLVASSELKSLFLSAWPQITVLTFDEIQEFAGFHLPLLDVPVIWRGPLPAAPYGVPYLPLPETYEPSVGQVRVGLCWSGRTTHPDDAIRSMNFENLLPLLEIDGIEWVCMQKEQANPGLEAGLSAVDLSGDFLATAKHVANLDLVISVDTSIAHLAAAMGKPVWLMLPTVPDWRWMLVHELTPWYPNMRLFRQVTRQDWKPVIMAVRQALASFTS